MQRLKRGLIAVAAAFVLASPAAAQDYPTRTVRVIIPLGAGGGGDIFIRAMSDELQKRLGQTFVVENRAGGGLNIGTRACAEAAHTKPATSVITADASFRPGRYVVIDLRLL